MSLCWVEVGLGVGLDQFGASCSQLSAARGPPRINFKNHALSQLLFPTPGQTSRATSEGPQQLEAYSIFQEFHETILCENL